MINKIKESVQFIEGKITIKPEIGLILGSGLGDLADKIEASEIIDYSQIPHFPVSTVKGHKGRLVIGTLEGKKVIAMQGRFHYYEGYSMQEITYPVRVMKQLGVSKLIVTNAAGGVNKNFNPGQLMIIKDHINFMGNNPLIGKNLESFGERFPDMTNAYDIKIRELIKNTAQKLNINIEEGVYAGFSGPNYETPAEIRMLQVIGVDAVGMSTVPEVLVAVHSGIQVAGISCITNMAAGILQQSLNHHEVIETAAKVKEDFKSLVKNIIKNL